MPRGFRRLPFLGRRAARRGADAGDPPSVAALPLDPDAAPLAMPVLMPAAIFRQVLVDSTEMTPVWARPRTTPAAPVPAAPTEAKPVKRTRRVKSEAPGAAPPPKRAATPRRQTTRKRPPAA